ncbi:CPBP family intramembrane glutamic endopeptidase [Streptomyces tagetis]|uniref:CPBP family intramembrane metalloprotease n=1 Tax=Streptomyces tagetis TaxID=2820809 RepID=A0A940XBG6_9ACTN|nr:CPBP family intramembrane glutamic endopeptidase [Streptomyces sp. RG38]MBQ0827238.1 CPBP family intramembrane metalloprotease [Streptomyces sp. RG38]
MTLHTYGTGVQPPPDPARPPRAGARAVLRRRPLASFFIMAFALSWAAWTPYILSGNGLGVWAFTFPGGQIGSQLLGVLPGAYLGPIVSALLVTAVCEGREGLRAWRRRMANFRIGWWWYVVVALAVPAALIAATTVLTGHGPVVPPVAVLVAVLPGLAVQMITTGLAEEPGWREFAMPRMQERLGPVAATLVVGVLWGAWHLPLFLTEWGGGPRRDVTPVLEFLATVVAFSFVMTWIFNRTGGSMPLVMLTHVSVNNFVSIAWTDTFPKVAPAYGSHAFLLASLAAAVVILAATRGRLGIGRTPQG